MKSILPFGIDRPYKFCYDRPYGGEIMAQNRKRTERIEIRATPEEKKALTAASAAAGLTMTAFLLLKIGEVAGEAIADKIIGKEKTK